MNKQFTSALPAVAAIAFTLACAPATQAAQHDEHAAHQAAAPATAGDEWVNAEVRRIDTDAGKLTLRHEAIRKFDMTPMTMAFRVAAPSLMGGLAVGDKVRFRIDKVGQHLVVTGVQKQP